MKRWNTQIIWGLLLIAGGCLLLLESLEIVNLEMVWPLIFAVAGLSFCYLFLINRNNWWAAIPGLTLLGLSALIGLSLLFPERGGDWGASIFLGSIGLAFFLVYLRTSATNWWALIPAGVLTTLALVVGLEPLFPGDAAGGLFMMGLGLTFGLLFLLPTGENRMTWALYPSGILTLIGVLLLVSFVEIIRFIGPLFLILAGGYMLLKPARAGQHRIEE